MIEAEGRKAVLLAGDIQHPGHCRGVVQTAVKELGGIAPTTNNTSEAFGDIIAKELAVLPKTAKGIGLQLD